MQYGERFPRDLDLIAEVHSLSARERFNLARIVSGVAPGNRDRGLFLLARNLVGAGSQDLVTYLLPGAAGLRRGETALLDFLVTVALDSAEGIEKLIASFQAALAAPDPAKAFVPALSQVLHAYRSRVLPESRHHNVFTAIRRYFSVCRPEDPWPRDGDAPQFWQAEGRREFLARYVTALRALADYAEAARLAATWRDPVALDDAEAVAKAVADPETGATDFADDLSQPAEGLTLLARASVKLLLAHERETLLELAEHAELVTRTPGDVLAALTMGPVQNAVTQALRRHDGATKIEKLMLKSATSKQILDQIEALSEVLSACLLIIYESRLPCAETVSVRSSAPSGTRRRMAAMERRQGFSELTPETRAEILTELIEPVLLLREMVDRYLRAFAKLGPSRCVELEAAHRLIFSRKLAALYGEGVTG
jgi:hypothetical protein